MSVILGIMVQFVITEGSVLGVGGLLDKRRETKVEALVFPSEGVAT